MNNSTPRVFYLGLNMVGAVSAGAYTAGVMDFLIDALDSWYAERERQKQKFGNDFDRWEIPAHEVRLLVLTGASAGGMSAAIAATALCEAFTPVRAIPDPSLTPPNRLYKSWVTDIDAEFLLGHSDLQNGVPVQSLLDSTRIDAIASDALRVTKPLPQSRPYVIDGLKVILTLTNLVGIPYAIENDAGAAETRTLYHADQQKFEIWWNERTLLDNSIPLNPNRPENWAVLREAAKATGAFPLALAPRVLHRTKSEYDLRKWRVSMDKPEGVSGEYQCETLDFMLPNWDSGTPTEFSTLNVDGGVTNNSPFDCATTELSFAPPQQPINRLPRSASEADRAVISVAPFLSTPQCDLKAAVDTSLLGVFGQLIDTVINQSRIEGENIKLTRDGTVYNRFAISPSIDKTTVKALASASLGAFGGFIAREFRDHDYQLGRRNCQRFLEAHFGMPLTNVVMREYAPSQESSRRALLEKFGMTLVDGTPALSVIPLVGELRNEIRISPNPIDRERLSPLVDKAAGRLKLVAENMLRHHGGAMAQAAFKVAWLFSQHVFKNRFLRYAGYELARQGLLK